jgi:hypothetical protein
MTTQAPTMQQISDAFTHSERIEKEAVAVIIRTRTDIIAGYMHIRKIIRFIDTLLTADKFIVVTNATVHNQAGQVMFRTKFLSVNRDEISYIIPRHEMPGHKDENK